MVLLDAAAVFDDAVDDDAVVALEDDTDTPVDEEPDEAEPDGRDDGSLTTTECAIPLLLNRKYPLS